MQTGISDRDRNSTHQSPGRIIRGQGRIRGPAIVLALLFAPALGCVFVTSNHPGPSVVASGPLHLPAGAVLVGGGASIDFTAPCDGVVFLVDRKGEQLIASYSLKRGEQFNFNMSTATMDGALMKARAVKENDPGAISLYFLTADALAAATTQPG